MHIRSKEYLLFWAGLFLAAISLLLSFTPIHWQIEKAAQGVSDEYYPELFWLLGALPLSVILAVVGFIFGFMVEKKKSKEGKQ